MFIINTVVTMKPITLNSRDAGFIMILMLVTLNMGCVNQNRKAQKTAATQVGQPVLYKTAVEEHGRLRVSNGTLVNKVGEKVQLRGISLFWSQWYGEYYNKETIAWLKKDWNVNVVRAAMAIEHEGYLDHPEVEKSKVFEVIDAAIEEGIYVIVDWHDHHAEDHLDEAITFFKEVAKRYGDHPHIIYEIYNEPLDVSWNEVLKPYHEAVLHEIRQFDSDNLVICGTRNWSQQVDEVINHQIDDPNVAYTLHYYAASHKSGLRAIAQKALDHGVPIFVTEFGTTEATGDGFVDEVEARLWWDFLDQNNLSWCNWSLSNKNESSALLKPETTSVIGGWQENELTLSGNLVRAEIRSKNKGY